MKYLIVDIETESLDKTSKIHCICSKDTSELDIKVWTNVRQFIEYANTFDFIVFHNGIRFDYQVLLPYGLKAKVRDTLIDSKICFPKQMLYVIDSKINQIPSKLVGSYSLKAFGYRLKLNKIEFDNFDNLTDEMIEYCKRDVEITEQLFYRIQKSPLLPNYQTLFCEYRVAYLMDKQEEYGIYFDKDKALELYSKLYNRHLELEQKLIANEGYILEDKGLVEPKRIANLQTTKAKKPIAGPYHKIELKLFNPRSRQQIAQRLALKGIQLEEFTEKGSPKITERVLEANNLLELKEYLKLNKDISQLMGNLEKKDTKGLIALCKDNRLHGRVDYLSCATHRASHTSPNLTQVPKTLEFRGLFVNPPNKKLIGIDADQLELMILGYWLEQFGNTEYLKSVATGSKANGDDVHTRTQHLIGLPTRDAAKGFSYATIYGAGGLKLGLTIQPNLTDITYTSEEFAKHKRLVENKIINLKGQQYIKVEKDTIVPYNSNLILYSIYGTQKKDLFVKGTDGMSDLIYSLEQSISEHNYITSLDGRKIYAEAKHKALNYLCQSSGAIFMKYYLCETYKKLKQKFVLQRDYAYVANIHDALVIECLDNNDLVDSICEILNNSFIEASKLFNFSYPIRGYAKAGNNFYEIFKD